MRRLCPIISLSFFPFSVRRGSIRRARIARDPRDATVARRRRRVPSTMIFSLSRFLDELVDEREAYKCLCTKKITAERKRKTDRRRDPRDAASVTPPETSERRVRVGTPRRQNARTRGNVYAFFREIKNYFLLKCIIPFWC